MKSLLLAALAATALTPLAAAAGDTTVIHERHVEPGQPATVTGVTTAVTTSHRTVVRRVVHRARYVRRAPLHHAVRHVASAVSATTAGRNTADVVTSAVVTPPTGPTVVDRRTVVHHDDDGTVRRHTTIQRQNPDGSVTAVERRSTEVAPTPPATDQSLNSGPN